MVTPGGAAAAGGAAGPAGAPPPSATLQRWLDESESDDSHDSALDADSGDDGSSALAKLRKKV